MPVGSYNTLSKVVFNAKALLEQQQRGNYF
jgi:hypothetical protein